MSVLLTERSGLMMKLLYMMLVLCGLISHVSGLNQSSTVKQDSGVISAGVGENVTLHCFYNSNVAMHFSWYRQTLGGKPHLLSTIYKYDADARTTPYLQVKKNPRFLVQYETGINHLHITDIEPSDSATYYCGSAHSNVVEFGEGVFVSVKESSPGPSKIVQLPLEELVQPGESVTLNCTVFNQTCDGGHHDGVYWLRHGHHPVIIHADNKNQSNTSCIYHLQRKVLNWTDTGMYYCAVASCGQILFGNGSKVDIIVTTLPQIRTFVILSISRCGILLLFIAIYTFVYFVKVRSVK